VDSEDLVLVDGQQIFGWLICLLERTLVVEDLELGVFEFAEFALHNLVLLEVVRFHRGFVDSLDLSGKHRVILTAELMPNYASTTQLMGYASASYW
jgi:hypothetical protein